MYTLKQIPEDFIVIEKNDSLVSNLKDKGSYVYLLLKKKERNSTHVVKEIANQLSIKEREIGFAGTKDKRAVTEQYISIPAFVNLKKINSINLDNCELKILGYADTPISLGQLDGNKFRIVVRNLENEKPQPLDTFPNYFDEQRFSENNVEIGRAIVKKDFVKAVKLIDNFNCVKSLDQSPNDYIGALKKISLRILKMYVHAYQSYLWNETLIRYIKNKTTDFRKSEYSQGELIFPNQKLNDIKIPLIGFTLDDFIISSEIMNIIDDLLDKEDLVPADFMIRQIPEISSEGDLREAFAEVLALKMSEIEDDELNLDKKKITLNFTLNKGSYATMFIKAIFVK